MPANTCPHSNIRFASSQHASEVTYQRPNIRQRSKALGSGSLVKMDHDCDQTFAAPLVLPRDDLADEDTEDPQSVKDWLREEDRNDLTPSRRTIYIAAPPAIQHNSDSVRAWEMPQVTGAKHIPGVRIEDVVDYVAAFYHGLPVKVLDVGLSFVKWDTPPKRRKGISQQEFIGLQANSDIFRIRVRPSLDSIFDRQLNSDDILDAAIDMLPSDAYCLLMLVDHDLYEDDEDVFICGRAYGGSRAALVSAARYRPDLDSVQGIDRAHSWPASHCQAYIDTCCAASKPPGKNKRRKLDSTSGPTPSMPVSKNTDFPNLPNLSPMKAALKAYLDVPILDDTSSVALVSGLWLARMCRTISHELGHCFGIGHCVYYACLMQGSASIQEDPRQPPDVCPIDLAKIVSATGAEPIKRYEALLQFCQRYPQIHLFVAFAAWIRSRLGGLESMPKKMSLTKGRVAQCKSN